MPRGFSRFLLRRVASAALLVLLVSSAAFTLTRLAPGDDATFESDPEVIAAIRREAGLDRPFAVQYGAWLARMLRMDLGQSLRFRKPVAGLLLDRAANTALLGLSALAVATLAGIPLGVFTGSRRGGALVAVARGASLTLLSLPPLVMSLVLLMVAARTGWFPTGGLGEAGLDRLHHLILPALALALPIAASLERIQSRSMRDALADPCVLAAFGRGIPRTRVVWRHAFRLSLKPVLAIYGIMIGSVLSGAFIVEVVMSWQGLGYLMWEALTARDINLVAGCAAAGAVFLAAGVLLSDLALAAVDPRAAEPA